MAKIKMIGLTLYGAVALYTFGYAARHFENTHKASPFYGADQASVVGVIAAGLWPLYFAWELQP